MIRCDRGWAMIAGWATVIGGANYVLWSFVRMPPMLAIVSGFAIGPLAVFASYAVARALRPAPQPRLAELGGVFGACGGLLFAAMIIVQRTMLEFRAIDLAGAETEAKREVLLLAYRSVDSIQLGLDVAMDVFMSVATVLFALAIAERRTLLLAVSGVIIPSSALTLNFIAFPLPPSTQGLPDLGPLIGVWALVLGVVVLLSGRSSETTPSLVPAP